MSYSVLIYTADGSVDSFPVTFPYLSQVDVKVTVDGVSKVLNTDFYFASTSLVKFYAKPTGKVVIRRETPRDSALVDFQDAAILTETDLDTAVRQSLYISQESLDTASGTVGIPPGESQVFLPDAASRAGRFLAFDSYGTPTTSIVNYLTSEATIAAAVQTCTQKAAVATAVNQLTSPTYTGTVYAPTFAIHNVANVYWNYDSPGAKVIFNYDSNDYHYFDRTNNVWGAVIGGSTRMTVSGTAGAIGFNGPAITLSAAYTDQYAGLAIYSPYTAGTSTGYMDGRNRNNVSDSSIQFVHNADGSSSIDFQTQSPGAFTDRRIPIVSFQGDRNVRFFGMAYGDVDAVDVRAYPRLGQFASSLASKGYQKLPNGLLIQWGPIPADGAQTFAIAFPTALVSLAAMSNGTANGVLRSSSSSLTGFVATSANVANATGTYIAIGY